MMVAQAAPLTPHPKYIMNTASSTTLTPLQIRVAHRGDLVSPNPLNTPCSSPPSSQQQCMLSLLLHPSNRATTALHHTMSCWPATCQLVHLRGTLQWAIASSLADNPVWAGQTLSYPSPYIYHSCSSLLAHKIWESQGLYLWDTSYYTSIEQVQQHFTFVLMRAVSDEPQHAGIW